MMTVSLSSLWSLPAEEVDMGSLQLSPSWHTIACPQNTCSSGALYPFWEASVERGSGRDIETTEKQASTLRTLAPA